jgi:hypothetical protein
MFLSISSLALLVNKYKPNVKDVKKASKDDVVTEEIAGLEALYGPRKNKKINKKTKEPVETSEIADYEKYAAMQVHMQLQNQQLNILKFWHDHSAMLPTLSKIAFDVMIVPAASTSVERVFSHCGVIVSNRRNRLSDETIRALTCMKLWGLDGLEAVHKASLDLEESDE